MTPGIDPKVVGIEDEVRLYIRLPDQVPGCTYDIVFEPGVAHLSGDVYVRSPLDPTVEMAIDVTVTSTH